MSATTIRYRGKVINSPLTENVKNEYVEGFYQQIPSMTKPDVIRHCIYDHPVLYEVDPVTVHIIRHDDLPKYDNPVTTTDDIKELQQRLVQTCVDFIKEKNLTDIDAVRFNVDGLTGNAIEFGEWVPAMDSYIGVEGLQEDTYTGKSGKPYTFRVRKFIGEYM